MYIWRANQSVIVCFVFFKKRTENELPKGKQMDLLVVIACERAVFFSLGGEALVSGNRKLRRFLRWFRPVPHGRRHDLTSAAMFCCFIPHVSPLYMPCSKQPGSPAVVYILWKCRVKTASASLFFVFFFLSVLAVASVSSAKQRLSPALRAFTLQQTDHND